MLKGLLFLSLFLATGSFADPRVVTVPSVGGGNVSVTDTDFFAALAQSYKSDFLRYSGITPLPGKVVVIANPEIQISGVWYGFNNCKANGGCEEYNDCATFGYPVFLGAEVRPNRGKETVAVVDRIGRFSYFNTSGAGYVVTSLSCGM